jgi:hypothetical protein
MAHTSILALGFGAVAALAVVQPATGQTTPRSQPSALSYPADFFETFRPTTAQDMVGNVPGFTFDGGSSARGYAGNAGNVLIDGRRPPEDLTSVLSRIPASAVERIDLVRGGAGGLDMHGKSVILNIIRRHQVSTTGAVNATLNSDFKGAVSPTETVRMRRQTGERTFDGALTYGVNQRPNTGDLLRLGPLGAVLKRGAISGGGGGPHLSASGTMETPFARGQVHANLSLEADGYTFYSPDTLSFPGGQEISANHSRYKSAQANLRYSRSFNSGWSWEAVALQQIDTNPYNTRFDTSTFTSGSINTLKSGQSVASTTLTLPVHGAWTTETGAEAAYNWQDTSNDYSLNGAPLSVAGDRSQVAELRTETFVTTTWRPRPNLSLELGARYEQSRITARGSAGFHQQSLGYLKPRINIAWSPSETDQFGLRAERTVDQLDFGSFASHASFSNGIGAGTLAIGNPELRPSNTWTYEARYEKRFAKRGSVLLQYAHTQQRAPLGNLSIFVPDPVDPTAPPPPKPKGVTYDITRNIGPATGDSFVVNTAVPLDNLGLKGGLLSTHNAWNFSTIADPETTIGRRLSNQQPLGWNIILSQNAPKSKWSWSASLFGPYTFRSYSGRSITAYNAQYGLGALITYQIRPQLTLSAGVNSLMGGDTRVLYTQFDAPRDSGMPAYFETTRTNGVRRGPFTLNQTF